MSEWWRDLGMAAVGALGFLAIVAGLRAVFGNDLEEQTEASELEVNDQIVPCGEPAWHGWQRVPVIDVRPSNLELCRELVALGVWRVRHPLEADEDVAARTGPWVP